ncbi:MULTISPECIES: phosphoribosylanthranilate isomerase [unclassified Prochlorococcus]|uniref:phosphoribosylanthranilate isomerase n=1 Tax=unclassified Prochlorococcus TaxID=2627481 RepID=UPI0005337C6A|nr:MULTISPECIES: phosphoribosylanthranilate isomerase [unclassified Prochlorococcus]KGG17104.1 Phosphoribosylanthranilate isomerase [Prochlorococcus sp. MIT 0603]
MNSQPPTAVKICGVTQIKQAIEIAKIGADAIGVIGVDSSPRFVQEDKRRKIFGALEKEAPSIERVWVVANLNLNEICEGLNGLGLPSIVQLHGQESRERCEVLRNKHPNIKWWKAFQIRQQSDLILAQNYQGSVDAILLDAWSEKALGGTGARVPIEWLKTIDLKTPWWLAGGISSDLIEEISSQINPFGIDASSKLETHPGIKNIQKVNDLINKVKKK